MPIKETVTGPAVVLTPDSNITWRTQPELKSRLDSLSSKGRKHIVIDLSNVSEISGYGLGLLASRCGRLRRQDGDICLANPSTSIKRLLHVTHLGEMFRQFDSADSAVRSLTIFHPGTDHSDEEDDE